MANIPNILLSIDKLSKEVKFKCILEFFDFEDDYKKAEQTLYQDEKDEILKRSKVLRQLLNKLPSQDIDLLEYRLKEMIQKTELTIQLNNTITIDINIQNNIEAKINDFSLPH